jgi:hypothetical protein
MRAHLTLTLPRAAAHRANNWCDAQEHCTVEATLLASTDPGSATLKVSPYWLDASGTAHAENVVELHRFAQFTAALLRYVSTL